MQRARDRAAFPLPGIQLLRSRVDSAESFKGPAAVDGYDLSTGRRERRGSRRSSRLSAAGLGMSELAEELAPAFLAEARTSCPSLLGSWIQDTGSWLFLGTHGLIHPLKRCTRCDSRMVTGTIPTGWIAWSMTSNPYSCGTCQEFDVTCGGFKRCD